MFAESASERGVRGAPGLQLFPVMQRIESGASLNWQSFNLLWSSRFDVGQSVKTLSIVWQKFLLVIRMNYNSFELKHSAEQQQSGSTICQILEKISLKEPSIKQFPCNSQRQPVSSSSLVNFVKQNASAFTRTKRSFPCNDEMIFLNIFMQTYTTTF